MLAISSNQIKLIKSLSNKKIRDKYGLFVVEGEKMVTEAVDSGLKVEAIFRKEDIGEAAMTKISSLSTPSPVLAVLHKKELKLDDAFVPSKGLYLALDSLRDPGNLGTIIRISEWFGIDGVFATEDSVDIFNPKVVQSTMGAIFRVKFHYTNLCKLGADFLDAGGKVYGTFLDGANIYGQQLSNGEDAPVLIVIGNESHGISPVMSNIVSDRLFIPPYPSNDRGSESLNAAIAAAVTVAEFRRRTI